MKQFLVFVKKEFYHVFRDRRTLLILFGLPIAQVLLFGFALTTEVKNANLVLMDNARDIVSEQIINKIAASGYFNIQQSAASYEAIQGAFQKGTVKIALVFPANFGRDLVQSGNASIQVIADASDPNTSKTLVNYINSIVADYQAQSSARGASAYRIQPVVTMLYNPSLNGSMNFVPGVIALVLMIICTTLTSVSIAREKETGTMEILLVSPFKPIYVILSKAVPYMVLSFCNFIIILLLGVYVLDVPVRGNVFLLCAESILFIVSCLSLGLLISGLTSSQQTAMLISMMGMMLPTILFTGFLFPIENMPVPLQVISNIIPSRWYYKIIKAIMLKGLGFQARYVVKTVVLIGMTLLLLTISLKSFKTRLSN